MDIAERVKSLIVKEGKTQKEFAKDLAISPARLNNYMNAVAKFPLEILIAMSERTRVSLTWLITGKGDMYISTLTRVGASSDVFRLPVLADIAAGTGIEAEDLEPSEYISIPRSLAPDGGSLYCFRVQGVSMEPELHTGDYAIISAWEYDQDYDGSLCAFRSPDGLLIKRLVYDDRCKRCLLIPLNPTHKIIQYNEDNPDLQIIGRLVAVIRKYDQ